MDAAASRRARAFLDQAHCPAHSIRVLQRARLLLSEIVTNAVRHGSPPITTELECRGTEGMHVRVSDAAPGAPVVRKVDLESTAGGGWPWWTCCPRSGASSRARPARRCGSSCARTLPNPDSESDLEPGRACSSTSRESQTS
ncbi:ATP-binding protein [Quadrisphaera setariae]|uniref:ATP-binding protein n=1 Tax=Quadrisphaera setariae TaxID=2593304 RepID=A0A5C8Z5D1_9ACTN|nr:ATP-binding protein [Streptomyces sp. NP160]TXR52398.1 ATP-binding protein [Quadrisphaera setariae]